MSRRSVYGDPHVHPQGFHSLPGRPKRSHPGWRRRGSAGLRRRLALVRGRSGPRACCRPRSGTDPAQRFASHHRAEVEMFIRKLFTLFRAYEVDAGQAVIDAHALKILEQELRDAAAGVGEATRELTGLMARAMADGRAHEAADRRAREHEAYALKALEKGDEALARQ